jgi:hypothetical protein
MTFACNFDENHAMGTLPLTLAQLVAAADALCDGKLAVSLVVAEGGAREWQARGRGENVVAATPEAALILLLREMAKAQAKALASEREFVKQMEEQARAAEAILAKVGLP